MKNTVIYINLDGFAKYYYEEFKRRYKNTFLETLETNGIYFPNLVNALPSITNPCQNQILSGSSSEITHNIYRYYDKNKNIVIGQKRENDNKTIVDVALENNISTVSICHFLLENSLLAIDRYIYPDETSSDVVLRGESGFHDYYSRLNQLEKLLMGEKIISNGKEYLFKEIPNLIVVYCDDLDGIGHNHKPTYGYAVAKKESERIDNVIKQLKGINDKLEHIIYRCKEKGIYDNLTFFITTDHGMSPFGMDLNDYNVNYAKSSLTMLKNDLLEINSNYKLEMTGPGCTPEECNICGVGCNLNLYLTFLDGIDDEELNLIKNKLASKDYIYEIKTRKDLKKEKFFVHDTDLLIVPSERRFFSKKEEIDFTIQAQHDSTLPTSHEIYGVAFGKGLKKGIFKETCINYDFGTTMAEMLNIKIPNSNGKILDIFS